jgi:hypothetical protein
VVDNQMQMGLRLLLSCWPGKGLGVLQRQVTFATQRSGGQSRPEITNQTDNVKIQTSKFVVDAWNTTEERYA